MNSKIKKGLSSLVLISFLIPINIARAEEPSKPKVVITYTGSTTDKIDADELVSATICLQNVTNMTDFSISYKYSNKAFDIVTMNSNSQITNLADDESFKDTTSVLSFGDMQKINYSVKFKPESPYSGTCKIARFVLQTKASQVLEFDDTDFAVESFVCDGKDVDYDLVIVNTTTNSIVSDSSEKPTTESPSGTSTENPSGTSTDSPIIDEPLATDTVTTESPSVATESPKPITIINNTLLTNDNVVNTGTVTPSVNESTITPVDDGKGDLGKGPLDGWTPVKTSDSLYTDVLVKFSITILLTTCAIIFSFPAVSSMRRFKGRRVSNE